MILYYIRKTELSLVKKVLWIFFRENVQIATFLLSADIYYNKCYFCILLIFGSHNKCYLSSYLNDVFLNWRAVKSRRSWCPTNHCNTPKIIIPKDYFFFLLNLVFSKFEYIYLINLNFWTWTLKNKARVCNYTSVIIFVVSYYM